MATVAHQGSMIADGTHAVTWAGMANGDVGDAESDPQLPYKTFQVTGTFGTGGSVAIEGSNTGQAGTWVQLRDWNGSSLAFTATRCWTTVDNPRYVRPHVTAGDGTTLVDVTMVAVA